MAMSAMVYWSLKENKTRNPRSFEAEKKLGSCEFLADLFLLKAWKPAGMETGRNIFPVKWWVLVTTSESKLVLKDVLSEQRTKAKKTTSVCCPISFHLQFTTCPCKLLPTTSNSRQRLSADVLFVSLSQMFVQDIKEPLGFHGIAIDGVFNLHLDDPWRMLQNLLLGWWAFIPYHSTETECVLTVLTTAHRILSLL